MSLPTRKNIPFIFFLFITLRNKCKSAFFFTDETNVDAEQHNTRLISMDQETGKEERDKASGHEIERRGKDVQDWGQVRGRRCEEVQLVGLRD